MGDSRDIIFIIDDDITNLTVARKTISDKYDVLIAPSGDKLFLLLEKVTPSLILLDIEMPGMDGYEVVKLLKGKKSTSSIPVVFLTAKINDVTSIIRMRAADSQIRFVANIDSNLPNKLIGDETRIRQVLINILGNAVKYTDQGFVVFSVNGEISDEGTINFIFEIKDSGRGIKQGGYRKAVPQLYSAQRIAGQGSERSRAGAGHILEYSQNDGALRLCIA